MAFSTNLRSSSGSSGQGRGGERQVTQPVGKYSYARADAKPILNSGVNFNQAQQREADRIAKEAFRAQEQARLQAEKNALAAKKAAEAKAQEEARRKQQEQARIEQERFQREKAIADQRAAEEAAKIKSQQEAQTGASAVGWLGRTSVLGPDWKPGALD